MALGSAELHCIGNNIVNQHMDIKPYVENYLGSPKNAFSQVGLATFSDRKNSRAGA